MKEPTLEDALLYALKATATLRRKVPSFADDILQAARIGAWRAWLAYDPGTGIPFEGYAYRRVMGSVGDAVREQRLLGYRRNPGEAPVRVPLPDSPVDHLEVGWEVESEDTVRKLVAALPWREREFLERLFLHADTITLKTTGRHFGRTEFWATYMKKDCLESLRRRAS